MVARLPVLLRGLGEALAERDHSKTGDCARATALRAGSACTRRMSMQAMHGLRVSFRKRGRLVGCCAVLALALSAMVIAPAGANAAAAPTTTYLALGDSISFGFTVEKFAIHKPNESPSYFQEG